MDNPIPSIDAALVTRLVASQFPRWAALPVRTVARQGWDNRTFRLGEELLVRLPSAQRYVSQVEREHRWLPVLAPQLPLAIPQAVSIGHPLHGYPWKWSVRSWIEGDAAGPDTISSQEDFATSLAHFLRQLQGISVEGGPPAGAENFFRGGLLATYDEETRRGIVALAGKIDAEAAMHVWQAALTTRWTAQPVWVHGDVSLGNLLTSKGKLHAVIDFGQMCVGDPACDLAIAWTCFRGTSRDAFRSVLALDEATWNRGRGWALWKAVIVAARLAGTNTVEGAQCWATLEELLADVPFARQSTSRLFGWHPAS